MQSALEKYRRAMATAVNANIPAMKLLTTEEIQRIIANPAAVKSFAAMHDALMEYVCLCDPSCLRGIPKSTFNPRTMNEMDAQACLQSIAVLRPEFTLKHPGMPPTPFGEKLKTIAFAWDQQFQQLCDTADKNEKIPPKLARSYSSTAFDYFVTTSRFIEADMQMFRTGLTAELRSLDRQIAAGRSSLISVRDQGVAHLKKCCGELAVVEYHRQNIDGFQKRFDKFTADGK